MQLRLRGFGFVVASARVAARRFPLVIVAGGVAAFVAIALADHPRDESLYMRLGVAATLGLSLLFALTLLAERRARSPVARWLVLGAGVGILVAVTVAWPSWSPPIQADRYVQLGIAFHLLAAFLPYVGYHEPSGFWQYNKGLFLRFLTAALYSAVLYGGLAIALLALDRLFGAHVPGAAYLRLWFVIAFVFNTWFFVGGVPTTLSSLEGRTDYPEGLRIFTQYVLVPIVAIYLGILTVYLGKVVITRQWPSGWIGYLVSSVASVGILSWLLVQPLEAKPDQAWVRAYTRGFYLFLMPAIVMLWLAIWKRVREYGITEPRYFLLVLSVWLAGIAVYYSVRRVRSIKVIPATLCAVAVLTFGGPWGAYAASRASQERRLGSLLAQNGLLVDGRAHRAAHDVPLDGRRELSAVLTYLLRTHGRAAMAPWFGDSVIGALPAQGDWNGAGARVVMASLGLDFVGPGERERPANGAQYFNYYASPPVGPVRVTGFDYAVRLSTRTVTDTIQLGAGNVFRFTPDHLGLEVVRGARPILVIPLDMIFDSADAYRHANPARPLPAEVLRASVQRGRAAALLCLTSLAGAKTPAGATISVLEGELFLRLP